MATDENLEMVDIEDEVELVMEESSKLDYYEIKNEATELELDSDKGEKDGTVESKIEENPEASTLDAVADFLPLEKANSPV